MNEIDLNQLRRVVNALLDHVIETRGVDKVIIDQAYYWAIPDDSIYDLGQDPAELNVGNLVDDWEMLQDVLEPDAAPVAYQLTELAPLIRYIGEKLGPELAPYGG